MTTTGAADHGTYSGFDAVVHAATSPSTTSRGTDARPRRTARSTSTAVPSTASTAP